LEPLFELSSPGLGISRAGALDLRCPFRFRSLLQQLLRPSLRSVRAATCRVNLGLEVFQPPFVFDPQLFSVTLRTAVCLLERSRRALLGVAHGRYRRVLCGG